MKGSSEQAECPDACTRFARCRCCLDHRRRCSPGRRGSLTRLGHAARQVFVKDGALYAFRGLGGKLGPIGVHAAMLAIMAGAGALCVRVVLRVVSAVRWHHGRGVRWMAGDMRSRFIATAAASGQRDIKNLGTSRILFVDRLMRLLCWHERRKVLLQLPPGPKPPRAGGHAAACQRGHDFRGHSALAAAVPVLTLILTLQAWRTAACAA